MAQGSSTVLKILYEVSELNYECVKCITRVISSLVPL